MLDAVWRVVYVLKIIIVQAAIRTVVRIRNGAKIENVHKKKESPTALNAMMIAEMVCSKKSSLMVLLYLQKDTELNTF